MEEVTNIIHFKILLQIKAQQFGDVLEDDEAEGV